MKNYVLTLDEEQYKELLLLVYRGAEATVKSGSHDVRKATIQLLQNAKQVDTLPQTTTPPADSLAAINERLGEFLTGRKQ